MIGLVRHRQAICRTSQGLRYHALCSKRVSGTVSPFSLSWTPTARSFGSHSEEPQNGSETKKKGRKHKEVAQSGLGKLFDNDLKADVASGAHTAKTDGKKKKLKDPIVIQLENEYKTICAELRNREGAHREVIEGMSKKDPAGVFTNHRLNLSQIEVFGFDFDFVLASYTKELQPLIYNLAKTILVEEFNYPQEVNSFIYDSTWAIRGLHFDTKRGLLMKLDFMQNVNPHACYMGRKQLTPSQIRQHYPGYHVATKYFKQNMRQISDLFQLSEASLLADVIQFFEDQDVLYDPAAIYRDIKSAVQQSHKGKLHECIRENMPEYVHPNPDLAFLLHKLKKAGKEVFLLTNNIYINVDTLMTYLTKDQLPVVGVDHWSELFDVVMTKADKPNFYTAEDRPFRKLNKETHHLTWDSVTSFKSGEVYVDGCLKEMMKIKKYKRRSVLYMGDHIRNDLVDAVKHWGWRTCAIIRELEKAIECHNTIEYRMTLFQYESLLPLRARVSQLGLLECKPLLRSIDSDLNTSMKRLTKLRHDKFGCVFKSMSNETFISYQLLRFADVYTSRVENFLQIPLEAHFTPRRRLLAHDINLTAQLH